MFRIPIIADLVCHSNIAFVAGHNSAICVPSKKKHPLLPVIRQASTESHQVGGDGANARVLLGYSPNHFAQSVLPSSESDLMARGWVFQEVRLAPANLFCAGDQTWWCCAEATACEICPAGRATAGQRGQRNLSRFFADLLEQQRQLFTQVPRLVHTIDPMAEWLSLLETYCGASLTRKDADRLVALAGLARRLRALYPQGPFGRAVYHSGIWSTDIERQLLWQGDTVAGGRLPKSPVRSATHPIPSWSPFSHEGAVVMTCKRPHDGGTLPQVACKGISPAPDDFGRAQTKEDAAPVLHLSGVLVPIVLGTHTDVGGGIVPETTRAHPRGYADVFMAIYWDNLEEVDRARASASAADDGQLIDYRALVLACSPDMLVPWVRGILLRPRSLGCQQQQWVRCGYIEDVVPEGEPWLRGAAWYGRKVNAALGLDSYRRGNKEGVEGAWEEELGARSQRRRIEDIYIH